MKIEVEGKLRPFSHKAGTSCVIPGTGVVLNAFPTKLVISEHEILLPITGPVKNFTLFQDLERDCVFVCGTPKEGYFKLKILATKDGFEMIAQKGPIQSLKIEKDVTISKKKGLERLSLGSHKAQDWDLVKRRKDLREILPTLYSLSQKIPKTGIAYGGTTDLLNFSKDRKELERSLLSFFEAAFSGLLTPRLFDDDYQGFSESGGEGDPFFLLEKGGELIRSLFFQQNQNTIFFLPNLPISFDAGRMIGIQAPGIGIIDLEWSKKRLKKVILKAQETKEIFFKLQKDLKRFRVNRSHCLNKDSPLEIIKNRTYFFDRFEK